MVPPSDARAQASSEAQTPDYYKLPSCDLSQRFKDFDFAPNFAIFKALAKSGRSQSFVLDYGPAKAWCAFDLSGHEITSLLKTPRPATMNSRWIHIWYPHIQPERIGALADKYKFSPRLSGLMRSNPLAKKSREPKDNNPQQHHSHHFHWPASPKVPSARFSDDQEQALELEYPKKIAGPHDWLQNLGHYDIVNSIWHWSSVDLGKKYLCLGYNALHNVTSVDAAQAAYDLPNGERIWNWLILCDDNTVISITESNLIVFDGDVSDTRQNLLNVLCQLSNAADRTKLNPISIVPIRYPNGEDSHAPTDTSGLLFYYLFDDWYTTYSLLAKHDHQYGHALNELREDMMKHAQLSHVEQLFKIGRQLAALKRIYQSYELLIDKVLEKHKNFVTRDINVSGESFDGVAAAAGAPTNGAHDFLGVSLSADAMVRFERLRDRIRLYVLSEVQECIDTKESLLMVNFNLITIKESDAVERLTRITILLGKVTIMFLPVSLVTGYFSVQIPGLNFTVGAYWISFAVTLVISFITLFVFGKISGTTEGDMVYKPINRVILDLVKNSLGRQRRSSG